jgi:DNA-binding MarR family transcriptional regulator
MGDSDLMSEQPPTVETLRVGLFYAAWLASTQVGLLLDQALAATGMPPGAFAMHSTIGSMGPMTPTEIATITGMPLSTVVFQVRKLIARGHVERRPHPTDRRSYQVALSTEGQRLFDAAGPAFRAALHAVADRLEDPNRVIADVVALANAVAAENAERARTPPPRTWLPFEMPNA